nr:unnamed protein product [Digitaria exilis]
MRLWSWSSRSRGDAPWREEPPEEEDEMGERPTAVADACGQGGASGGAGVMRHRGRSLWRKKMRWGRAGGCCRYLWPGRSLRRKKMRWGREPAAAANACGHGLLCLVGDWC